MYTVTILLFACLLGMAAAHAEKKVYRCTSADGTAVFSPDPCGAGAREMKVDTTAAPSPAIAQPAGMSPAAAESNPPAAAAFDAEDNKCRQDAAQAKTYLAEANLNVLLLHQGELMRKYTENASEAIKVQIGNLDAAIAVEQTRLSDARQHADRTYADAIAKCDARKALRDKQAVK